MERTLDAREARDPELGALAGAVGGLVGGLEKLGSEAVVPPRPPDRRAPPDGPVERLIHREAPRSAMLASYDALPAFEPRVTDAVGGGSGLAVWAGAHELAHALWGATVEIVRGDLRHRIRA